MNPAPGTKFLFESKRDLPSVAPGLRGEGARPSRAAVEASDGAVKGFSERPRKGSTSARPNAKGTADNAVPETNHALR